MAKDKRPRGLGRTAGVPPPSESSKDDTNASSSARFNPLGNKDTQSTTKSKGKDKEPKEQNQDQDMTDVNGKEKGAEPETASLALQGDTEAGDELSELRQTYDAAQKQFVESGAQEYLRGTIHECDRMVRNCGKDVYPSAEFNYIYASALHDFSVFGAEPEEVNGFVELGCEFATKAGELLKAGSDKGEGWLWKYHVVAGRLLLQKADALHEEQEAASSKKQYQKLGNEINQTLKEATILFSTGFPMIPEGEEKYTVRLDKDVDPGADTSSINKSIIKVVAKAHERISAAANVAIHADRFDDYDRRKQWNEWALQTYRDVTQDTPENVEAWQGIATCLHSIVGWWADQADEEAEMEDEDEEDEEPEDEYSLPIYSTERGQMSLQAVEAIQKAIELARKSEGLTSDLLTLGAECHLNLVNIAVGDKAAAEQSRKAVALIKEAIATFPDPALEDRYSEVLREFEEITKASD
ncbi:hypothetical protein BGX34_009934 [Mortierella sp. NVP85]|nr:hypothetical protein BGX34_009934 [Mortierella sp. NVP85]